MSGKIPQTNKYFEIPFIKDICCAYCGVKTINYRLFDKQLENLCTHTETFNVNNLKKFVDTYNGNLPKSAQMQFPNQNLPLIEIKNAIRKHFRSFFCSAEHIFPEEKGGQYTIDNLLSTCSICNNERKSEDFSLFLQRRPEIRENIIAQLLFLKNNIAKLISERKLSKVYINYPKQVAKTILEQSKGELDIRI